MKEEIIEIINKNYNPDLNYLDKETIADEIINLVGWDKTYNIGTVDDPFDVFTEFEEE